MYVIIYNHTYGQIMMLVGGLVKNVPYIGNFIILTDYFFRGVATTNQVKIHLNC